MSTTLLMCKRLGSLRPISDEEAKALRPVIEGEVLKITFSRPRNIKFHNKFFVMLKIVLDNQDHYKSMEELLGVCKIRIGHVDVIETPQGQVLLPKSISFAKMDAAGFQEFYDRAVDWVLESVIPNLQRQHLNAEVEAELIGFAT